MIFQMYLDDNKVGLRFGKRPHLGVRLPGTVHDTTAGFDHFRQKFVRWKISVPRTIALKRVRKGLWEVHVDKVSYDLALDILMRDCTP